MKKHQQDVPLRNTIQNELLKVGVILKNAKQQVHFDSEEACQYSHQGQWSERLAMKTVKQKPNATRKLH